MKFNYLVGFLIAFMSFAVAAQEDISEEEYYAQVQVLLDSMERQTGTIKLDQAGAALNVPDTFYYLSPEDTEKVLVDLWGNPGGQDLLGMIFPAGMTPMDDDSWAVTIGYEEDGYVSDANAQDIDYNDLLSQMQADTRLESEERVAQGYSSVELLAWASSPYYDATGKKLYWAQELKFGEIDTNTLNYNIRILGRKGVLVLNFIASIDQKREIEDNLDSVLALAEFEDGSRYAQFNPDIDTVAAYGLGALVAGKVIAKTGLLAILLIFLKKFGVLIVLGAAAFFKSVFSKKKE